MAHLAIKFSEIIFDRKFYQKLLIVSVTEKNYFEKVTWNGFVFESVLSFAEITGQLISFLLPLINSGKISQYIKSLWARF